MSKTYSEMTAAERLADRIAKNREVDRRVKENQNAAGTPAEGGGRRKAVGAALVDFQRIKNDGGKRRAEAFSAARRKAIAQKAAKARWGARKTNDKT